MLSEDINSDTTAVGNLVGSVDPKKCEDKKVCATVVPGKPDFLCDVDRTMMHALLKFYALILAMYYTIQGKLPERATKVQFTGGDVPYSTYIGALRKMQYFA